MDQAASSKSGPGEDVIGITLTVDESGQQPFQVLKFAKSSARVIEIGRRSAQAKSDEVDGNHALFRCPVISRRHAKITFSEYGNVYIMDLRSHHGTSILRPGGTISRAIPPEVPSVLADGDIITLGKAVGKDPDTVSPITIRVNLQIGESVSVATTASSTSRESTSPKSSSGRYGIFLPFSDASSSFYGSDSSDSDVEEIPPPFPPPSLQTHGFEFSSGVTNLLHEATCSMLQNSDGISLFRRHILPPIFGTPSPEPLAFSPEACCPSEDSDNISDRYDGEVSPELGELETPYLSAPKPLPANSPNPNTTSNAFPEFIGAWPKSPEHHATPSRASPSNTPAEDVAEAHASSAGGSTAHNKEHYSPNIIASDDLYADVESFTTNVWIRPTPPASPSVEVCDAGTGGMVEQIMGAAYQSAEKARQAGHQTADSEDDYELDGEEASRDNEKADQPLLPPLHSGAVEVPNCQPSCRTITTFNPNITEERSDKAVTADVDITMADAVSEDVATLKSLVQAMKELHKKVQEDAEKELISIKTARVEAEEAVILARVAGSIDHDRAQRQVIAHTSELNGVPIQATSPALKRKRSDIEDDAEDELDTLHTAETGVAIPPPVAPMPKRRRTMRIVSKMAQTTAVATLGAVAAWTALAFS